VLEDAFGGLQVGLGVLDVLIESRSEVVEGLLSRVERRLLEVEVPRVLVNLLSDRQGVEVVLDLSVLTEVRHGVVEVVAKLLLGVLVLGAASGGADGVGLQVQALSNLDVLVGVIALVGMGDLESTLGGSRLPDSVLLLLISSVLLGIENVGVSSEVGDLVVMVEVKNGLLRNLLVPGSSAVDGSERLVESGDLIHGEEEGSE